MSDAARAAEFLKKFHYDRELVVAQIERLSGGPSVSSQDVQNIAAGLNALSTSMAFAMAFLPAYDQRLCSQQVKDLELSLEQLRQKVPKSRFAFKRRAVAESSQSSARNLPAIPKPEETPVDIPAEALRKGQHIDLGSMSSLSGAGFTLEGLDSCVVDLLDLSESQAGRTTALYARKLQHCAILVGYIDGSVRLEECEDCVVLVAAHQFRMERCRSTDIYLSVESLPVIEQSGGLRFGSYPFPAKSVQQSDHHSVKDFSWIQDTPSPNWSQLSKAILDFKGDVARTMAQMESALNPEAKVEAVRQLVTKWKEQATQ